MHRWPLVKTSTFVIIVHNLQNNTVVTWPDIRRYLKANPNDKQCLTARDTRKAKANNYTSMYESHRCHHFTYQLLWPTYKPSVLPIIVLFTVRRACHYVSRVGKFDQVDTRHERKQQREVACSIVYCLSVCKKTKKADAVFMNRS